MRIVKVETALHSGAIDVSVDDRLEVARLSKLQRSKKYRALSPWELGVRNDEGPLSDSHGLRVSVWTTGLMESA